MFFPIASTIFPLQSYLCIGTMCGRILAYGLSDGLFTEMPGSHKRGTQVLKLTALCGTVTNNWLISSIGVNVHGGSDVTANIALVDKESVPCEVLLSLGSGYHEMFKSQNEVLRQHILAWCFIKDK